MRNVLFLSRGEIGGGQTQLGHVVACLEGRGYRPIVVCRQDGAFAESLRAAGVPTYVVPLHPWRGWPAAVHRYGDVRKVARIARHHEADLIHASDLWLSGYLIGLGRKLNLPSVLHVRAPLTPAQLRKHRCGKADALIAISHRVRDQLLAAGVSDRKITVIYDAVDLDRFRESAPTRNVLRRDFPDAGEVLVGIVGRVDPFKRQLDFLRIAEQTARLTGKSVTFFIIGDAHDQEYYDTAVQFAAQSGLNGRAVFTGPRNDMPEVVAALDILVTLSGGSVMLEAMACGKPVVSAGFTQPDQSFIVQHGRTGLLVPYHNGDGNELCDSVAHLIDSPELRERLGSGARRWAQKHFSHHDLGRKTCDLYDRLVTE